MKEFKGTPGEWHYSHARGEVVSKSEGLIAELVVNGQEDNNGSLIAAAPDLLEALQQLLEDVYSNNDVVLGYRVNKARAAISKALGED
ncbi:hypothetical protein NM463_002268 [Citrobacter koseri]|nr:hypothetical protein [Citrobacter koseri]